MSVLAIKRAWGNSERTIGAEPSSLALSTTQTSALIPDRLGKQGLQALPQVLARVPIDDDDGDVSHTFHYTSMSAGLSAVFSASRKVVEAKT